MGIVIAVPPLFTWARYEIGSFVDPNGYNTLFCAVDPSNSTNYISFLLFYYGLSYWLPFVIVIIYLGKRWQKCFEA